MRKLKLQVGGTLNPRKNIYINRPEDDRLFELLREGKYVNVLSSRQMGKSSLMVSTAARLTEDGIRFVAIDLAGEMGGALDSVEPYYLGLLAHIVRDLRLSVDLEVWWRSLTTETWNQRLLRFFRELVSQQINDRVVIFLDEIDSTLKLSFTDDLFTAIRSMYNDRPIVPAYEQISFCLIGVATANELIKDRRTTPYNVGETLELDDFDASRDDLKDLELFLHQDEQGRILLERVLYWTGGHPYLTAKLCTDLLADGVSTPAEVDRYVEQEFANLERVRNDTHFQSVLRFVEERLSSGLAALKLYRRIYRGAREKDVPGIAQNELKLSGLIKRDADGCLKVRNPIYRRVFDKKWMASLGQLRQRTLNRSVAIGALLVVVVLLVYVLVESIEIPGVTTVKFSPDGKKVVTTSFRNYTASIWDVESGKEIFVLNDNQKNVSFAAFSPDSKRVVTVTGGLFLEDETHLWDVDSGKKIAVLKGYTSDVTSEAFSPDGQMVVTALRDGTARIWDVDSGKEIAVFKGHPEGRILVGFTPDGKKVVTASWNETRIWDVSRGKVIAVIEGMPGVTSVSFNPDGKMMVTGLADGTARLWDVNSGKEIAVPKVRMSESIYAAFSPDGKRLVAGSYKETRIWDVDSGKEIAVLKGRSSHVTSEAFSPDGKVVVTVLEDGTPRIWNVDSGKEIAVLEGPTAVWGVTPAFSPNGKMVVTISTDGTPWLWQTKSGRPVKPFFQRTTLQSKCLQVRQSGTHISLMVLTILGTLLLLDALVIRSVIDSGLASSWAKAAWAMIVVFLPFLGILFWFIFKLGRRKAWGKVAGVRKA